MVSKTQPVIPPPPPPIHLETIYEESGGSHASSIVDIHHPSRNRENSSKYSTNQASHGLISARSIPSVDTHRRKRPNEYQQKPPIEVRYRDGTKRFIHPSFTTTSTTVNRRKHSHSSRPDSSSTIKLNTKYRQIFNTTPKKNKKLLKKPEITVTIITAEELSQAGITPPSTSSPDESDTLPLTKSPSNSSTDTYKTVKDISTKYIHQAPREQLPTATVPPLIEPVQPVFDISMSTLRFPFAPRHHSHHPRELRQPQQIPNIRSRSLPPSQSHLFPSTHQKSISNQIPPIAVVPPSQKRSLPSLQITLTDDENERNLTTKVNLPKSTTSSSKSTNETMNSEHKRSLESSTTVLVGGGSRSAFRPFLKSTNLNPQPRIPLNNNIRTQIPTNSSQQQPQQIFRPSHPYLQPYRPTSVSSMTRVTLNPSSTINPVQYDHRSVSSDALYHPSSSISSNQILSDKLLNSTSQTKTSNYPPTMNMVDNSFNIPNDQNRQSNIDLITIDPSLQWHSITSKSLYDVPRLSHKYSDIPLHITITERTPTHNQKLVHKHDTELEKRLLDAGLSPETIALYERILEVADIH